MRKIYFSIAALLSASIAYLLLLTKKVCMSFIDRFSFILSLFLSVCAAGMLYNSVVTPSPIKVTWVTACTLMMALALACNYYVWKEDKNER